MHWTPDPHGALTLTVDTPFGESHIWINARQTYCDRGHWQWGWQGGALGASGAPDPSYYFMTQANARREIEAWLVHVLGGNSAPLPLEDRPFASEHFPNTQWRLEEGDLVATVSGKNGQQNTARIQRHETPKGDVLVFSMGQMELDDADRFPRVYRCLETAIDEAERFLAWRLLKVPAEIPGRIEGPNIALGEGLGRILGGRPRPAGRRP